MGAEPDVLRVLFVMRTSGAVGGGPLPTSDHVSAGSTKAVHMLAYPTAACDRYRLHRLVRTMIRHMVQVHRPGSMGDIVVVIMETRPCQRKTQRISQITDNAFAVNNGYPSLAVEGHLLGVVEMADEAVTKHNRFEVGVLIELGVEVKDIPGVLALVSRDIPGSKNQALGLSAGNSGL